MFMEDSFIIYIFRVLNVSIIIFFQAKVKLV
jgi:hypothetical protein